MVDPGHRPGGFFDELKRRRVVRVGVTYAAAVFVLLQVADIVLPALEYSDAALRPLLIVALLGFPIVLLLAWLFDLTPEGIVRTAKDSSASGRIVIPVSRVTALGAIVATVLVVAAGVVVLRPGGAEGAVAEDARVIAVLPFAGSSDESLAEGVMDLLSRNLDGIGPVRTIDPLRTLNRLRDDERGGNVLEERALAVGSAVGAGSVLMGSIAALGASVTLSASLKATADGRELATAQVRGSEEDLLSLIDDLSGALLRQLWRGEDLPSFDVASLTTHDFNAVRAFLEGERYYRASQWDSAMASFARAIEADEDFALAYYRFATAAGWGGSFDPSQLGTIGRIDPTAGDLVRQAAQLARETAADLPERERMLIAAQWLRATGRRAEALDTTRLLVQRFPGDVEPAYQMADDVFHLRDEPAGLLTRPIEQRLELFDDVLELEPEFRPALIHPIEMAMAAGREDLAARYIGYLSDTNPLDEAAKQTYEAGLAALAERDVFGFAGAFETGLAAREQTGFVWQAANGVLPALLVSAAGLPAGDRDELIAYLMDGIDDLRSETRQRRALMAADLLLASGRSEEALELLERPNVARLVEAQAPSIRRRAAFAGLAPPEVVPAGWERIAARGLAALDAGDAEGLRTILAELSAPGAVQDSTRQASMDAAFRGFLPVLTGDTVGGLASVQAALANGAPGAGSLEEALWFRWARTAVAHPETRARAVEALGANWLGSGLYEVGRLGLRAVALRMAAGEGAADATVAWCETAPADGLAAAAWAGGFDGIPCEDADNFAGFDDFDDDQGEDPFQQD